LVADAHGPADGRIDVCAESDNIVGKRQRTPRRCGRLAPRAKGELVRWLRPAHRAKPTGRANSGGRAGIGSGLRPRVSVAVRFVLVVRVSADVFLLGRNVMVVLYIDVGMPTSPVCAFLLG
jgi:hypothetical protein